MIKLYYRPGACSLAPHIALEWIGQPYELEVVQRDSTLILDINPAGAVPVLDTGEGWVLTQAGAILDYLDQRFPEAKIGVNGDIRHDSELKKWSFFLTGDLHPAFYGVFAPNRYTTSTQEEQLKDVVNASLKQVRRKLAILEQHFENNAFLTGEDRTYADAYLFTMLRWADNKLPDRLESYPYINNFFSRIGSDEAVVKALTAETLS